MGLVGDLGDDASLQKEARQLTDKWLKDRRAVQPDLVELVVRLAGQSADASYHQKLLDAAKAATDRHDRMTLLSALAMTEDPALVKKNLEILSGTDFDPREGYLLLFGALGRPQTREVAYDFVKGNWDVMAKSLPKQAVPFLVGIAGSFCDPKHREDAEAFFKPRTASFPGADQSLGRALETVDLCIALKEKQQGSVSAFLRGY